MYEIIDLALRKGANQVEILYEEKRTEHIIYANHCLKQVSTQKTCEINLQVVKDGKIGVITCSNLKQPELLVNRAIEIAQFGNQMASPFIRPAKDDEKKLNAEMMSPNSCQSREKVSTTDIVKEIESALAQVVALNEKIRVNINISRQTGTKKIVNSNGLDLATAPYQYWGDVMSSLVDGDNVKSVRFQLVSENGKIDFSRMAERLTQQFQWASKTVPAQTGKYPIIFSPTAMSQIAFTLVSLEGDSVVKGISPLKDRLNTQIFDEQITLVDDGTLQSGLYFGRFDDEGTPTQRTVLVENGFLRGFIHDSQSAQALGVSPTGNGWKFSKGANISFNNLLLEPGKVSFADMVRGMDEGILIDSIPSLYTGNILQGNIDSNLVLAYKIERGEVVGKVNGGVISANVFDILGKQLVSVGDELSSRTFGEFVVFAPYVLCRNVHIIFR